MVAAVAAVTVFADIVKLTAAVPVSTLTVAGTVTDELDELRCTTAPAAGGNPFKVTVPDSV
jgi:hypothetical protein